MPVPSGRLIMPKVTLFFHQNYAGVRRNSVVKELLLAFATADQKARQSETEQNQR
jgi:hypothetical protein